MHSLFHCNDLFLQKVVNVLVELTPWLKIEREFVLKRKLMKHTKVKEKDKAPLLLSLNLHVSFSPWFKPIFQPWCPFVSDDFSQYGTRSRRHAYSFAQVSRSFTLRVKLKKRFCFTSFICFSQYSEHDLIGWFRISLE